MAKRDDDGSSPLDWQARLNEEEPEDLSRLDAIAQVTIGVSLPVGASIVALAFGAHGKAAGLAVFGIGLWCGLPGILGVLALLIDARAARGVARIESGERKRLLATAGLSGLLGSLVLAAAVALCARALGLRTSAFLTASHILFAVPGTALFVWLFQQINRARSVPSNIPSRIKVARLRFWLVSTGLLNTIVAISFVVIFARGTVLYLVLAALAPGALYSVYALLKSVGDLRMEIHLRREAAIRIEELAELVSTARDFLSVLALEEAPQLRLESAIAAAQGLAAEFPDAFNWHSLPVSIDAFKTAFSSLGDLKLARSTAQSDASSSVASAETAAGP